MDKPEQEEKRVSPCVLFTLVGPPDRVASSPIPLTLRTRSVIDDGGQEMRCLVGGSLPGGRPVSGRLQGCDVSAEPAEFSALDEQTPLSIPGWVTWVRIDPAAVDKIVARLTGQDVESVTLARLHEAYKAGPMFDREPCPGFPADFAEFVDALDVQQPAAPALPAESPSLMPFSSGAFSAAELATADLPPVRWAVNGLLPTGLALLVAAPKVGKSWAALDLALSVAGGLPWMGRETVQGEVLYLALEDSAQRLQSRMGAMLATSPPAGCEFLLQAPDLGHGLLDRLSEWRNAHASARLVVVDTFQRIRTPGTKSENAYEHDYQVCSALQHWAMQSGVCLLLLHHTRKTVDPADVFSSINGSSGIFGSADAVLTLSKRHRFDDAAVLSITGRDVMQDEFDVTLTKRCAAGPLTAAWMISSANERMPNS